MTDYKEDPDPPGGQSTKELGKTPQSSNGKNRGWRWRPWHEREVPVSIEGKLTDAGIEVHIKSSPLSTSLELVYPNGLWSEYPQENKSILLDNAVHIFTAHLPFLLKGNIRLEYNTGYPHSFSWASQCFLRNLPAYWYLYNSRRGTRVEPMLKTLLNSRSFFARTKDHPPSWPSTDDNNILIPFTFGKDSFITYWLAKDLGLNPVLVCFNDPMDDGYEGMHKKKLFKEFKNRIKDPIYYIDNPLGFLREPGDTGWFGWELLLTSWAVLALPIAWRHKTGYIAYSNERSVNNFFYVTDGYKAVPDYEQSAQATEELSILTQALSEGEVYTTTLLQGLEDSAIIAILKDRYYHLSFELLMSCWADDEAARDKRWCANCSKCARLFIYLMANGIDPMKEAGYQDNMLSADKAKWYNVFEKKAAGTGWDAFGLNRDEQGLAFYVSYLRGRRDPLIMRFMKSGFRREVESRFDELVDEYYSLHPEQITPLLWKKKVDKIFESSLKKARKEVRSLRAS